MDARGCEIKMKILFVTSFSMPRNGERVLCAICKGNIIYHERYPKAICKEHYDECYDNDKNLVYYTNKDEFGGFMSHHKIGKQMVHKEDHECVIRGIPCYANESRFGGIVIQTK